MKRILAGLALAFAVFSAHAGTVTIVDYWFNWVSGTPEAGGLGVMYYRESDNALKQFQVNVSPFADSVNNVNHTTDGWLTPVTGSDYTFDPVDLYSIWAEDVIFSTSMGLGFATWEGGKLARINFPDGFASWDITKIDPVQVSNVPEPGSLALLGLGMIGAFTIRKKKSGITQCRIAGVMYHLILTTKRSPLLVRGL